MWSISGQSQAPGGTCSTRHRRAISLAIAQQSLSFQVLSFVEKRHERIVRQLEQERQWRAEDVVQGDNICVILVAERERMQEEVSAVFLHFSVAARMFGLALIGCC